jgi:hypothetical protein
VLRDMVSFSKQAQLLIAVTMSEFLLTFPDRPRGTERDTPSAGTAASTNGVVVLQRKRGEDGYQAYAGSVDRGDEQVIPADPAQAGFHCRVLVRKMSLLALPIDNLGCGDRKRSVPPLLNLQPKSEGHAVEKKIGLAVMVQVKLGRPVVNIL